MQEIQLSLSSLCTCTYLLPEAEILYRPYCLKEFHLIWQGHTSGKVGVLHAKRTTLAFFSSPEPKAQGEVL